MTDEHTPYYRALGEGRVSLQDDAQHPPYNTDLSPYDFHIFEEFKKDIHGHLFASDEDVCDWFGKDKWINSVEDYFWDTANKCTAGTILYYDIHTVPEYTPVMPLAVVHPLHPYPLKIC